MSTPIVHPNRKHLRGFASMSKEMQREIARRGGVAAHKAGTAHEFSPAEASMAARIGHERGTAHEFTAAEAREAGRKGAAAKHRNAAKRAAKKQAEEQRPVNE